MAGLNKAMIIGHLGADPNLTTLNNGDGACSLSIATSKKWQDQRTGETIERTEWHRVVLFRKLAEIAGQYLRKGSQVYIEGELQTRKWQDKNGIERYTTEIVANSLQMLGKAENAPQQQTPPPQTQQAAANPQGNANTANQTATYYPNDDIPF